MFVRVCVCVCVCVCVLASKCNLLNKCFFLCVYVYFLYVYVCVWLCCWTCVGGSSMIQIITTYKLDWLCGFRNVFKALLVICLQCRL